MESPPGPRQARVLVVDDDAVFRMLAREALQHEGFEVVEAACGDEALELYPDCLPDLVLLDLRMPGRDGIAVSAELHARYGEQTAPVLMVTGATDDDSAIDRGFDAGASDFIGKPLNWNLLGHRARHLLAARRTLCELSESRASLANAQRVAQLGSYEWNVETGEVYWSEEIYRILDIEVGGERPACEPPLPFVHDDDKAELEDTLQQALQEHKCVSLDHRFVLPDGLLRRVRHQAEGLIDPVTSESRVLGTILDVTEHAQALEQLRYLAHYDPLTGLSNRRLFKIHLHNAIEQARDASKMFAVLFLDLDRFKKVNDTLGHDAGDRLLQAIADRIRSRIRRGDSVGQLLPANGISAVSRLGGDEFTLLLTDINRPEDAGTVARRILRAVPRPVSVEGQDVTVTASIGIAVYPTDGDDVDTLLKHADTAVYHAKDRGGNVYQFFSSATNASSVRTLALEAYLRTALEREELVLHYQPKVDFITRKVLGMEALLRWNSLEMGMVSPNEFIPLAEESGIIVPIGDWVLQTACKQNKAWQEAGLPEVPVAINVSSRQFANHDMRRSVIQALEMSGLDPRYVELEITESSMMQNHEETAIVLTELKELGLRVALDDFGTGYSSLSYLKRFPLDSLKIDRSFVLGLPHEADAVGIINAIIAMAHVLGLRVVAEGVETEAQAAFLGGCDCDEMQGYVFSKPLPAEEFTRLLESQQQKS